MYRYFNDDRLRDSVEHAIAGKESEIAATSAPDAGH